MGQDRCHLDEAQQMDELLDSLSHHHRREVIRYFENATSAESATIEDIASHIAQRVPEVNQENVAVQLSHAHVPNLQSCGWVDYDHRTQHVRYRGHDSAEELLSELASIFR